MSRIQKKTKNQQEEYNKRLNRVELYATQHEQYLLQISRITKQLKNWKEVNNEGKLVWKENLKFTEGDNVNEYDRICFTYPKPKIYILSRDKLRTIDNRVKHEKQYLNFLEQKLKKNKY